MSDNKKPVTITYSDLSPAKNGILSWWLIAFFVVIILLFALGAIANILRDVRAITTLWGILDSR